MVSPLQAFSSFLDTQKVGVILSPAASGACIHRHEVTEQPQPRAVTCYFTPGTFQILLIRKQWEELVCRAKNSPKAKVGKPQSHRLRETV